MDNNTRDKKPPELTEAAREARRAYRREWARKNPDKVRASQNRFWERKAAAQAKAEGGSQ